MNQFFPHLDKTLPLAVQKDLQKEFKIADKKMLIMSFLNFLCTSLITSYANNTYFLGIIGGALAFIVSIIAFRYYKGTLISRLLFGLTFSMYPIIMLQQQLGMVEMHFAFFYMVAFLMIYKDISACLIFGFTAIAHHTILTYLQLNNTEILGVPLLVFGPNCSWTIYSIHIIMWCFALSIFIYMTLENTRRFIEMKINKYKLENKADELKLNRHRLRTIIDAVPSMIFVKNREGRFLAVNKSFADNLGIEVKDIEHKLLTDLHANQKEVDSMILNDHKVLDANETFKVNQENYFGNEKLVKWLQVIKVPYYGEDFGEPVIIGIAVDITAEKEANEKVKEFNEQLQNKIDENTMELEESYNELQKTIAHLHETKEKLSKSEKMVSLGRLVAGVAHEINTPIGVGLTGITHFLDITKNIRKDYESDAMTQSDFENYLSTSEDLANQINSNLDRTAKLVRSFKQVATDQNTDEKRDFFLKEYMEIVILNLKNMLRNSKLNISITCDENLKINSYPDAYSQVITNLIINSVRHGYNNIEAGTIKIDISSDEKFLTIVYKDDGKGISKENIKKIFDPFFTTNRESGGIGLGLNIIYNIVTHNLNGTIECQSEDEKGTTFTIILPIA